MALARLSFMTGPPRRRPGLPRVAPRRRPSRRPRWSAASGVRRSRRWSSGRSWHRRGAALPSGAGCASPAGGRRRPPAGLAHPAPLGSAAPRRCQLRPEDHRRLRRTPLAALHRGLREGRRRGATRGSPGRRRGGPVMNDSLASAIADFLAHKRALGRKYRTEESTLRLLLAFADQHEVSDLPGLTPCLLEEFVASRPRPRARSFNHLVGVLGCFLDWAVTQQRLDASP